MEQTLKRQQILLPHEVFEKVEEAKGNLEKVEVLQKHATYAIRTILQANFKEEVKFALPAGEPPYTPDDGPAGNQRSHIEKNIKRLAYCLQENRIPNFQKENVFIKLLETVHAKDAKILIAMKDKKLEKLYKGLTEATVRKAFPNLLPPKKA